MPRFAGNEAYYQAIQQELDRIDMPWQLAEIELLRQVIFDMRVDEHKNHDDIQKHLEEVWGLKRGAYYRRVRKIREAQYVIP